MTAVLALSGKTSLGLIAGAVALLAIGAAAYARSRRREPGLDIPPAMGPGPSDDALEKPNLEKLQAWATVMLVASIALMAVSWIREPNQNVTDESQSTREAVERGRLTTEEFEEGVNPFGFACIRCHGPELRGGQNFFDGRFVPVPNLHDVCGRLTLDEVKDVIMQGRAGTDMPSWSVRFAGPMDDQQINDILQYLLSIQTVQGEANKCLNPPSGA